ncbi:MAG: Na+/H+ antiporter subunit E [Chromatiaceae bacterium]|nr:Na+/H+ antiporter subunit E [Gammaproteobacteria bacterium]MCP5304539.1 Na+/H+ antiporter subunit E [Chromatiaceae bacterium]MCP5314267.1 Na+/H+ antiporter subunit E [Chromatiaceae bacterium]
MRYLYATVMLFGFWMLLSGLFSAFMLSLGLFSVLLTVWFLRRMDATDHDPSILYPNLRLLGYLPWLFWMVVKSNIDLARRIWDPRMPIHPTWTRLDTRVTTPFEKTLYANSITLTPGTLTTDVNDDHFMVHSLYKEGIDELRCGEMERRILRLKV